jgi:RNA polymerase sigma-70 factor (ECF subfamily)
VQTAETPKPEVVEKLVANHRRFLAFLERRTGDRALAEDLLQEAFVRGIDRAGDLRDDESAVAWFYRALRNAVVDHHRRRGAAERSLASLARELEVTAPESELEREVCRCVADLADTLKPEYAEALRAIEVGGASVKDYAVQRGLSASNAGVRIFRAREALRRQVASACGTCAEHGCYDCTCRTRCGHAEG